jgi:hypothetical protein
VFLRKRRQTLRTHAHPGTILNRDASRSKRETTTSAPNSDPHSTSGLGTLNQLLFINYVNMTVIRFPR